MTLLIKAFIFDLDGVITDTAEFHFSAWKKLADKLGIAIDRQFNEQLKGVSRMESLERIIALSDHPNLYTTKEKATFATEKNTHYQQLITQLSPKDILPGINELIMTMKKEGYLLGIASASKNAKSVLQSLGLYDIFDTVADISSVRDSKPAPDIFLLAAKNLGVKPSECIGIEDAESGIISIQRAGMFAVGVGDVESLQHADYYVQSTKHLFVDQMIAAWGQSPLL